MKVIEYKDELENAAIEKLADDVFKEVEYMIKHNPYNNSMVRSVMWEAYYLGQSSNDFSEFKKRLKKIINLSKTIKSLKDK